MAPIPPPQSESVIALVQRAQRGESTAFSALFRIHVQRVNRIVRRFAGPRSDSDDLTQEIFVEAFRSLPSFRGEALFSSWLARIAVRVTMHAVKRRALRVVSLHPEDDTISEAPNPERRAGAREALRRLDRLLAGLKPKRRVAWVLHVLEGYSMEEITAIVGASMSAVKTRVHDARRDVERSLRREPWLAAEWAQGDSP